MLRRLVLATGLALALLGAPQARAAPPPNIDQSASIGVHDPLDQLTGEVDHLHPIAMMFLAKRLFDAGRSSEAVFWFYEAQLRWKAYLKEHPDSGEDERYADLFNRIGPDINVVAFGDVDAILKTIDAVIDWDVKHPDDYTRSAEIKTRERAGLKAFAGYVLEHRPEIEARGRELRAAAAQTGGDPYGGAGGAHFALPREMRLAYDPSVFAALRPGVTSRDEVLKALGKPEWWDTGSDGTSAFGYSYNRSEAALSSVGMTEMVGVTVYFDAHKVVSRVELPSNP